MLSSLSKIHFHDFVYQVFEYALVIKYCIMQINLKLLIKTTSSVTYIYVEISILFLHNNILSINTFCTQFCIQNDFILV